MSIPSTASTAATPAISITKPSSVDLKAQSVDSKPKPQHPIVCVAYQCCWDWPEPLITTTSYRAALDFILDQIVSGKLQPASRSPMSTTHLDTVTWIQSLTAQNRQRVTALGQMPHFQRVRELESNASDKTMMHRFWTMCDVYKIGIWTLQPTD